MNVYRKFMFLLIALGLSSCTPKVTEAPLTQIAARTLQTREFDTTDMQLVMKSMMHVLQDDGYIIKNAVLDLGLLSAEKDVNNENVGMAVLGALSGNHNARWAKHKTIEASANVSAFGSQIRVRINFQIKQFDNFNCIQNVKQIENPEMYQIFFEKVSKGIFIEQEGI